MAQEIHLSSSQCVSSSKSFERIEGRKGRRQISQSRQFVVDEDVAGQHVVVKSLNKNNCGIQIVKAREKPGQNIRDLQSLSFQDEIFDDNFACSHITG